MVMSFLGYLIWAVVILIALVPVIGLIAELCEWVKDKTINDYERGRNGEEK